MRGQSFSVAQPIAPENAVHASLRERRDRERRISETGVPFDQRSVHHISPGWRFTLPSRSHVLYERDDELDIYEEVLGGDMLIARGNSTANDSEVDDQIGIIGHGSVAPEGRSVVHRQMRADWFFPANEKGPEEYRALIWVLPEIRRGSAWSNEVVVNLK